MCVCVCVCVAPSVRVGGRLLARRVMSRGMFKGAVVMRGADWRWDDQDGEGQYTTLIRYTYSADYCLLLYMQWQNIEVVYIKGKVLRLDGAGHAPSLYTKYYRAW